MTYGLNAAGKEEMRCDHLEGMVCYLCSDERPWWRGARLAMGLPADPPNETERARKRREFRVKLAAMDAADLAKMRRELVEKSA